MVRLVLLLVLVGGCRAIDASESIAKDFHELKQELIPPIRDTAASLKVIRSFIAPSSKEKGPSTEAPMAPGGSVPWTGIWGSVVTVLLGYRFVGGKKVNVMGILKGVWGTIKGGAKGLRAALGKATVDPKNGTG